MHPHRQPTLRFLSFWCVNDNDVEAVTSLLCQCPNLSTLVFGCELEVSKETEMDMWKTAVTGCRNLEEVQFIQGDNLDNAKRSKKLLKKVLKNVSGSVDIPPLKLKKLRNSSSIWPRTSYQIS